MLVPGSDEPSIGGEAARELPGTGAVAEVACAESYKS